jgi:hypothetical protein
MKKLNKKIFERLEAVAKKAAADAIWATPVAATPRLVCNSLPGQERIR